jgi:hypothetical protein
MMAQARRVIATFDQVVEKINEGKIVLVGDNSQELMDVEEFYKEILPSSWSVIRLSSNLEDGLPNYKMGAQLVIARMRSIGFSFARRHQFDLCWSLDSDVLPPHNALACMLQMLEFDSGFYGVACCPYPSQGGGDFLGGRGTDQNPLLPDCYEDERLFPKDLVDRIEIFKKELSEGLLKEGPELDAKRKQFADEIQKCPPKGDVFFLNSHTGTKENPRGVLLFAKELKKRLAADENFLELELATILIEEEEKRWKGLGFRRRGWLSAAYPGIGLGSIVPIDWFGFGCNLLSKKALSLAQFEGYEGGGTEDLYVIRKKWARNGIRMCAITHCVCDHVIRVKDSKEFILLQCYHESNNQECLGHLRVDRRPWFQQVDGEKAKEEKKESPSDLSAIEPPAP